MRAGERADQTSTMGALFIHWGEAQARSLARSRVPSPCAARSAGAGTQGRPPSTLPRAVLRMAMVCSCGRGMPLHRGRYCRRRASRSQVRAAAISPFIRPMAAGSPSKTEVEMRKWPMETSLISAMAAMGAIVS